MKYPAYPDYSPTRWSELQVVPSTWDTRRLKFVLQRPVTDGPHTTPDFTNDGVPFLSVDSIQAGELTFEQCRFVSQADHDLFSKKAAPQRGDVLLGKAASTGKIAQVKVDFPFSIWSPLALLRPHGEQVNPTFLEFALKSSVVQAQIQLLCTFNTQSNISMDDIPRLVLPLPPVAEQEKIADFLDWRTAQIDALIAKKQALLDRMREEQDAVVTGAVTKGLAPNQPTKPSGVPWLGDVPRHWEVKRLKWAVTFQRGHDLPADDRNEGDVPLVSSSGISAVHDTAVAKAPGIVTGRYGTIGVFHLIEQDYWPLNTTLYSIDLHGNNPVFLCALLENLAPLFLLNAKKSAVPGVDRNDLHQIEVALPPREEQDRIADHLTKYEQKIKAVRTRVSDAIERLTEYRSALITAAVTGQIDVRGVPVRGVPVPA